MPLWMVYRFMNRGVEVFLGEKNCQLLVGIISFDFVDRLLRSEKSDPRNHTKKVVLTRVTAAHRKLLQKKILRTCYTAI